MLHNEKQSESLCRMVLKYKNIIWILNKQIELHSKARWCWVDNEFICVYEMIPKGAEHLFTPQQLLNKINKDADITKE